MTREAAVGVLVVITVAVAFSSEYLIASTDGVVKSASSSFPSAKGFIGIILLPIIGNAAEHYTAVLVAMRNKMDLSLGCAVGSSCQMALFVRPFCVTASWVFGIPMTLTNTHMRTTVSLLTSGLAH
eukprot:GHVS01082940.1.p1 GENE.GHVS01082940.1~~GHVS01082940.1.p1  ORF type:complete len:126 (-),score=20.64 GHVS01082940.1:158-535(-)